MTTEKLASMADMMGRKLAHEGIYDLEFKTPFFFMRDELTKIAAETDKKINYRNPDVLKAALKATVAMTVGGGVGYVGGRLIGKGVGKLIEKHTGLSPQSNPNIAPYLAAGTAFLGGVLMAAQSERNKQFKEVLYDAQQRSEKQRGAGNIRK